MHNPSGQGSNVDGMDGVGMNRIYIFCVLFPRVNMSPRVLRLSTYINFGMLTNRSHSYATAQTGAAPKVISSRTGNTVRRRPWGPAPHVQLDARRPLRQTEANMIWNNFSLVADERFEIRGPRFERLALAGPIGARNEFGSGHSPISYRSARQVLSGSSIVQLFYRLPPSIS